jgi:hypothetical protein
MLSRLQSILRGLLAVESSFFRPVRGSSDHLAADLCGKKIHAVNGGHPTKVLLRLWQGSE